MDEKLARRLRVEPAECLLDESVGVLKSGYQHRTLMDQIAATSISATKSRETPHENLQTVGELCAGRRLRRRQHSINNLHELLEVFALTQRIKFRGLRAFGKVRALLGVRSA